MSMGPSTILEPPPAAPTTSATPRDRLAAHALATEIARTHGDALMRTARRFAGDPDDAHDAYQRALELLLEHAATIDRAKVLPWMQIVVRREASALRRRHDRHAPFDVDTVDLHHASDHTDEQLSRIDLAQRAGEALAALKETEAQALCLRAQGLSYDEIAETYGWSYTKVNRAVSEGRKAFVDHYLGAERGDVCDDTGARIGQYLAGELRTRDHARLRAHLVRCSACRAQLHAERGADRALQALLPPVLGAAATNRGALHDHVLGPLADLVGRLSPAADHALGAKLGVVAVSTVALAGGGVTIERHVTQHAPPPTVRTALGGAPTAGARTPTGAPSSGVASSVLAGAADSGHQIIAATQRRYAAARRQAAARRKAAAAHRARQRAAAAREFSPSTTEFGGATTNGTTASTGNRSGQVASTGGASAGTSEAPNSAPVEVPADSSTSDTGIAVSDDTATP